MHVAVLLGGPSPEYEISLASGEEAAISLLRQGFRITIALIDRRGRWAIHPDQPLEDLESPANIRASVKKMSREGGRFHPAEAALELHARGADLAFLALHGSFGEDGTIQGFLETVPLPYTGSGVMASALAIDKIRSKKVLIASGLSVPPFSTFNREEWGNGAGKAIRSLEKKFSYPLVVKPATAGSSVGTSVPKNTEELRKAAGDAFRHSREILMEQYIQGVELTCPVLGNPGDPDPAALPVVEIVPRTAEFFNYEAKYTPGAADEIAPARIDPSTAERVTRTAVEVHRAIGCAGLTRTDMILSGDTIYVLEINTIPGLSEASICPKAAVAAGKDFDWLTGRMVALARKEA